MMVASLSADEAWQVVASRQMEAVHSKRKLLDSSRHLAVEYGLPRTEMEAIGHRAQEVGRV